MLQRKYCPLVTLIGTKIYALSAYTCPHEDVPDPCFEYLDLNFPDQDWTPLPKCLFRNLEKGAEHPGEVLGYAVLDDNFILVSLMDPKGNVTFYSYNIRANVWRKAIKSDDSVTGLKLPFMDTRAVPVDGNIYTYHTYVREVYVFSYTDLTTTGKGDAKEFHLSVEKPSFVKGMDFGVFPEDGELGLPYGKTGDIALVEGKMLCVAYTLQNLDISFQNICVLIIKLVERDSCIQLRSVSCALSAGDALSQPDIESCYVMDVEETNDDHPRKQQALSIDTDDIASETGMGCGVERGRKAATTGSPCNDFSPRL